MFIIIPVKVWVCYQVGIPLSIAHFISPNETFLPFADEEEEEEEEEALQKKPYNQQVLK